MPGKVETRDSSFDCLFICYEPCFHFLNRNSDTALRFDSGWLDNFVLDIPVN